MPPSDLYKESAKLIGNGLDHPLSLDEVLYLRFTGVNASGQPDGSDLHCLDMSVNRSKYSEALDVLLSDPTQPSMAGVGELAQSSIPPCLTTGKSEIVSFVVEHDPFWKLPEIANYSHCEIRAYLENVRCKKRLSGSVDKKFRQHIAEKIQVIRDPSA